MVYITFQIPILSLPPGRLKDTHSASPTDTHIRLERSERLKSKNNLLGLPTTLIWNMHQIFGRLSLLLSTGNGDRSRAGQRDTGTVLTCGAQLQPP
jgi:hypothetical protein